MRPLQWLVPRQLALPKDDNLHEGCPASKRTLTVSKRTKDINYKPRPSRFQLQTALFLVPVVSIAVIFAPYLLRLCIDILIAVDPSPMRNFSVVCFKPADETNRATPFGEFPHHMESKQPAHPSSQDELRACKVLFSFSHESEELPPFGNAVHAIRSAALCSLGMLRYLGFGPLLPTTAVAHKKLEFIGPILSTLLLLPRLSHTPVALPCERWLKVPVMRNKRGMLHSQTTSNFRRKEIFEGEVFDFVIAGGGTAGTTLAGLLSRIRRRPQAHNRHKDQQADMGNPRVLLLEAGGWPDLRSFSPLKIPAKTFEMQRTAFDWGISTVPQRHACKALGGRRSFWPRGKGLGGSSLLNYMLYVRGDPRDFESWSRCSGDQRWKFRNVLRFLKGMEKIHFESDLALRGNSGPIDVTRPSTVDASILAFLRSTQHLKLQNIGNGQAGEAGMDHHQSYKPVRDFNAARYHGASLAQFNIRDGQRRTPLEGYLFKGNLDDPPDDKAESSDESQNNDAKISAVLYARVIKVIFEPNLPYDTTRYPYRTPTSPLLPSLKARALWAVDERQCTVEAWESERCNVFEIPVHGELILSAGTIHTPQILMQSGVGDPEALSALGIQPVIDLPGVGKNLQDDQAWPYIRTWAKDVFDVDVRGKTIMKDAQSPYELEVDTLNPRRAKTFSVLWEYLFNRKGPISTSGVEAQVFSEQFHNLTAEKSSQKKNLFERVPDFALPDIQLHILNSLPNMDWLIRHVNMPWWTGFLFGTPEDWGNDPLADNLKGCIFLPVLLHPYSRGFVYLQPHVHDRAAAHGTHKTQLSREAKISFENPSQIPGAAFINPLLDPVVDPRYLEDERDLQTLLKGFEMVDTIVTSRPFSLFVSKEMRASCKPEQLARLHTYKPFTRTEQGVKDAEIASSEAQEDKVAGLLEVDSSRISDTVSANEELKVGIPADVIAFCKKLTFAHAEVQKGRLDALNRFYISHFTQTLYHPVGTCKMGTPDVDFVVWHKRTSSWHQQQLLCRRPKGGFRAWLCRRLRHARDCGGKASKAKLLPRWSQTSVVDGSLRLCGGICVQNIRIVDASIFPHLPSGNTHIPTVVLSHVAAEAIAEQWSD